MISLLRGWFRTLRIFHASLAALAIAITGCAGASVTPGPSTPASTVASSRPARIVLQNFAFQPSQITESSAPGARVMNALSSSSAEQRQDKIGEEAADALGAETAKQLGDLGFTVVRADNATQLANGDLLVTGKFVNVDEGNRLRRLVIGFGAGASKLDTQVNVYRINDGARQPVLDFTTHADSGHIPGAALTMGAGAAAQGGATAGMVAANAGVGGAKSYSSTVTFLSNKTAEQISNYMSQYFAQQGWISPDQARKAKVTQAD